MIERIITFSVKNKLVTGIFLIVFVAVGIFSVSQLSIDALPDVTDNQVLVVTVCPNLATQEVEQFITVPIETQLKSIPDVTEIRSTSRSGLSSITVVFKDNVPVNIARQQISERLKLAEEDLPKGYGNPEMVPPTTGLGEIYQYTLHPKKGFESKYSPMELRSIQDWVIRKQLLGVPGVVDVSTIGGYLKQYEVAVAPEKLVSMNISLIDVYNALSKNNQNTGGSYIEKGENIYFIRGEGLIKNVNDIENVVVKNENGIPIKVRDIAIVQFGYAPRFGAMTRNGKGETVGAVVLMLKGENSVKVIHAVQQRMEEIKKNLPEGLTVETFLDRSELIQRTIGTVSSNLIEGALIVIFILIIFLGNFRAGLIVATVIPLSMLFAITLMNIFGVTANLMSMGALDFGLVVDGAVIIVESILHIFTKQYRSNNLTQQQMDTEVIKQSGKIMSSAVFGQIIILIVYVPIFALVGIEGKMFRPMALTVSFAIVGALLLSLTYVPLMSSIFLSKSISHRESVSDKIIQWMQGRYTSLLKKILQYRVLVTTFSIVVLISTVFLFKSLGGEFLPEMDEGDYQVNFSMRQGTNLPEMVATSNQLEKIMIDSFPEVKQVVAKIGTSEVPTDPMPVHYSDLNVILEKDKSKWTSAQDKDQLAEKIQEKLKIIPGTNLVFEQPIQMRVNEMIAGVKSDIAIKIFGDNLDELAARGKEVAALIAPVDGIQDVKVEQTVGMPQLVVKYDRDRIAQYGLNIDDCNTILNTALAGGKAGVVFEGERKYDLRVRLANYRDADEDKVKNIFVPLPNGTQIPLGQLAEVSFQSAPTQISRENANRRIVIECNVKNRDIESVVADIKNKLEDKLKLPSGYYIEYGGTFENLQEAKQRLSIAVPVALLLIFLLLFISFRSITESLIIYSAIPLAAIGGVIALWLRGMNFSISAGIGFIALFGVAVLNGIVLIAYFNRLEKEGESNITERILKGTATRLRPVLATAAVASLGFLPMALSTSAGSEVQKPLATVVIGGLISSTLLTLIVLPVLYSLFTKSKMNVKGAALSILFISYCVTANAQEQNTSLDSAIAISLRNHPMVKADMYTVEQQVQQKKNYFVLDPLNLTYTGGQINSATYDYTINAITGIKFPTEISAQAIYQKQQILLAQSHLNVTRAELVKFVSLAYVQVQYGLQQKALLDSLEIIYLNFSKYAEIKYNSGETSLLEKVAAQSKLKEIQLMKTEAGSNLKTYESVLQEWMGSSQIVTVDAVDNFTLQAPQLTDTAALKSTPLFLLQKQLADVSISSYKLEKAKNSPTLQFGYFRQSLDRVEPFHGFIIGASIPFFKTGQHHREKAAQLGSKISEMEFQSFQLSLNANFVEAVQQFEKHSFSLNYYISEGLNLANTIYAVANTSYQNGDIGYTEYIMNISNAFDIRSSYLHTLNEYNQSIINLNFIIGK